MWLEKLMSWEKEVSWKLKAISKFMIIFAEILLLKIYIKSLLIWRSKNFSKMKVVLCLFACLAYAAAFPHPQGQDFNNEAIRQAQQSHLIPHNAIIHGVS